MKSVFATLWLSCLCSVALAAEYGHYDPKTVISLAQNTPGNASVTVNVPYFVQILNDLGSHAGSWPVKFDSTDDMLRAKSDVVTLAALLDTIADNFRDKSMLLRLALLHAIGHNLDIAGAGEKAIVFFNRVLEQWPNDPQANFRYGVFLASTARNRDAIPLLEKAKSLGIVDADYPLGLTYMALGEKDKAVANLRSYTARVPGDTNAARALDAVINGKVEYKQVKPNSKAVIPRPE